MRYREPEYGAKRVVHNVFLFFPKTICGETRWLERASWIEEYGTCSSWAWPWSGYEWLDEKKDAETDVADMEQGDTASGAPGDPDDESESLSGCWKCVICGCTDDHACEGGCYWVYPNLCSACAEKLTGYSSERHIYPVSAGYGDTLIIECPCSLKAAEVSKLADSLRNAMLAQTDKRPGIIILDGGLHLVGIIHRHENSEQREGTRGE